MPQIFIVHRREGVCRCALCACECDMVRMHEANRSQRHRRRRKRIRIETKSTAKLNKNVYICVLVFCRLYLLSVGGTSERARKLYIVCAVCCVRNYMCKPIESNQACVCASLWIFRCSIMYYNPSCARVCVCTCVVYMCRCAYN